MKISELRKVLRVDVPVGRSGGWEIKHRKVSKREIELECLRASFHGSGRGYGKPGTYTLLTHNKDVVMSDTEDEINDLWELFYYAQKEVLINGLGLGVALEGLFLLGTTSHITVIEKSKDVIKLTAEHYKAKFGERLTIILGDALTFKPPKNKRFNAVWHDIWPNMCSDYLPDMHKLHRKYGRRTDWQGSWCRAEMERHDRW